MKRLGTVLVFKDNVSRDKAAKALASIGRVLDVPTLTHDLVPNGPGKVAYKDRPFKYADLVHEFDEEMGGPVWYIP